MSITNAHISQVIRDYLDDYPTQVSDLEPVITLLDAGVDITVRTEFRGHATAGAILVNPALEVLHVHHVALDRDLLPGGHLETSDTTLRDAALRELAEETGIDPSRVVAVGTGPLDIDVHMIPANPAKGEPEHPHFDFRYLFATAADVGQLQAEEVSAAKWIPAADMADPALSVGVQVRTPVPFPA